MSWSWIRFVTSVKHWVHILPLRSTLKAYYFGMIRALAPSCRSYLPLTFQHLQQLRHWELFDFISCPYCAHMLQGQRLSSCECKTRVFSRLATVVNTNSSDPANGKKEKKGKKNKFELALLIWKLSAQIAAVHRRIGCLACITLASSQLRLTNAFKNVKKKDEIYTYMWNEIAALMSSPSMCS